ncbi:hypothetical protein GCM10016272_23160 [Psychrobacter glaciei]|uniref:Uncharacterized protein n=1 Tax=Psychrobacter glaciei TaxID=619771 RepID=A0ABQ3GW96_9GAMM|nr:hypothetical protein [Psychrobacter glaciei]GHD36143.1 hypothetical protein GCM10016272_23160 [Psychrobacter glaciei]
MSTPTLASLDRSLYPQVWEQQTFTDAHSLLIAMLTGNIKTDAKAFSDAFTRQLLANDTYQQWINFTVFGGYLQRQFMAFYRQTEDSFNTDMPALFRREFIRHAQYLPLTQTLFLAGDMPKIARFDKLLTTTVNPATAVLNAQQAHKKSAMNRSVAVINQITVVGRQVMGFPIRHNRRTSERTRNEVLILDFQELRLVNELTIEDIKKSNIDETMLLRYYELR